MSQYFIIYIMRPNLSVIWNLIVSSESQSDARRSSASKTTQYVVFKYIYINMYIVTILLEKPL